MRCLLNFPCIRSRPSISVSRRQAPHQKQANPLKPGSTTIMRPNLQLPINDSLTYLPETLYSSQPRASRSNPPAKSKTPGSMSTPLPAALGKPKKKKIIVPDGTFWYLFQDKELDRHLNNPIKSTPQRRSRMPPNSHQ
jgi:hypothetical protein